MAQQSEYSSKVLWPDLIRKTAHVLIHHGQLDPSEHLDMVYGSWRHFTSGLGSGMEREWSFLALQVSSFPLKGFFFFKALLKCKSLYSNHYNRIIPIYNLQSLSQDTTVSTTIWAVSAITTHLLQPLFHVNHKLKKKKKTLFAALAGLRSCSVTKGTKHQCQNNADIHAVLI